MSEYSTKEQAIRARKARKAALRKMGSRDFSNSRFLSGAAHDEGVNPMEGIGNLADAMLVVACGLMIALIIHWNVDLKITEVIEESQMTEIESIEEITEDVTSGDAYTEKGTVYEDPETGTMYLLEPKDSE